MPARAEFQTYTRKTFKGLARLSRRDSARGKLLHLISALFVMLCLAPPAAADAVVFESGHVDVFNVLSDPSTNELQLWLKEDITGHGVLRYPEEVILSVPEQAYSTDLLQVPSIGMAGYLLPLTQQADLLWPGWNTLDVAGTGFERIDIVFEQVTGPGAVLLFTQEGLSPQPSSMLADGSLELRSGSVRIQPQPAHTHAYWLFSEPGVYQMQVSARGENGGTVVQSNSATYTWEVGSAVAAQPANELAGETLPANEVAGETLPAAAPAAAEALPAAPATPGSSASLATQVQAPPPAPAAPNAANGARGLASTGSAPLAFAMVFAACGLLALGGVLYFLSRIDRSKRIGES